MKQKKFLYGLLMSVTCLSACSNEVETNDTADGNIHFSFGMTGAEVSANTRGVITEGVAGTGDYAGLKLYNGNLKIYAIENEGVTSTQHAVTGIYDIGSSTNPDGYYNTGIKWPNEPSTLSFHAFSPTTASMTGKFPAITDITAGTVMQSDKKSYALTGTNKYTNDGAVDLLYAKKTGCSGPSAVRLDLNHILSRITFQFRKDGFKNGETVTLKAIKLDSIYTTANGIFGSGTNITNDDTTPVKSSEAKGFAWNFTGRDKVEDAYSITPNIEITNTTFLAHTVDEPYLKFSTTAKDNSWFMLPHTLDDFGDTPGSRSKLIIEYSINSTDFSYEFDLKTLKGKATATPWRMGEWTNYQITINARYIVFNPITVVGWDKKPDIALGI